MINEDEKAIIDEYVDDRYYDKAKLMKYLSMHTIVGNEVFAYCDRRAECEDRPTYAKSLDTDYGYWPLSVSKFVWRIPFYFYIKDTKTKRFGALGFLLSSEYDREADKVVKPSPELTEEVYSKRKR